VKVLLDHNLDRRLRNHLPDHEVETTYEKGWATLFNGELLSIAEKEFDVLLTADANIKHQQNLAQRTIGIIVLRAFNNRLVTHIAMMPEVNQAILQVNKGELIEILHEDVKKQMINP
jgi:predicted nuclease of predicted toxin-antitoxin system